MRYKIGIQYWLLSIILLINVYAQQLYTGTTVSPHFRTELIQSSYNQSKNEVAYESISYNQIPSLNTFYAFTFHTFLMHKNVTTHSSYKVLYLKRIQQKEEYLIDYIHHNTKTPLINIHSYI